MRTPISYYGGKQSMLGKILPLIPDHKVYCEPFFGGGAVFFSKPKAPVNVINDRNDDLMNFYRQMRDNPEAVAKAIQQTPHSRQAHRRSYLMLKYPQLFTETERAWAVWVQTNMGFSTKIFGGFAYDRSGSTTRKLASKKLLLGPELTDMLQGICIECTDALKVIDSHDTPDTFFYCDPPYVGTDQGHYGGYVQRDFDALIDKLSGIEGKFMLSHYPNRLMEQAADRNGWVVRRYPKTVAVSHTVKRQSEELLVMNYRPAESS